MQIKDASLNFSQQHQLERSEQQRVIAQTIGRTESTAVDARPPAVSVDLSAFRISNNPFLERIEALEQADLQPYDLDIDLLKALVEAMSGKEVNTPGSDSAEQSDGPAPQTPTIINTAANASNDNVSLSLEGIGRPALFAAVDSRYREYEYSNVTISADLLDAEGEAFSISLSVTMERSFESREIFTVSQAQLQDPLVINFNGSTARLSNDLLEFDLDSDGNNELIPSLVSDSAYIALDKNGDGIINNGTELFGATSGQGFLELAAYDDDGNGFIDSNDAIFSQLVAYRMGDETSPLLSTLEVGALSTSAVSSPFRLTDTQNNTLGMIRSTGFYLDNQKQAGSLQQVDLRV